MGNFRGHAGPGTGMLILALPLFLRSLNIGTRYRKDGTAVAIPLFPSMRTNKWWLSYEGFGLILMSTFGFIMEYADMALSHNYARSHYDHLKIFVLLGSAGIFDVLHVFQILEDLAWGLVPSVCLALAGLLFNAHEQPTELRIFAHSANAYLLYMIAACRVIELFIGFYSNRQHHFEKQELEKDARNHKFSFTSPFFSRNTLRNMLSVNPIYSNPALYASVFPLLESVLLAMNGVWWWQMACSFYLWPMMPEHEKGHHGMMNAYSMLYSMLLGVITSAVIASFLIKKIVKRTCWRRKESEELEELLEFQRY